MLLLMALMFGQPSATIPALDALAQNRDVRGLASLLAPDVAKAHPHLFDFVRNGGSYGVGRFGWHVYSLKDVSGDATYAVFSSPLTCEDMGEEVLRWNGRQLTEYVPEMESFGVKLLRHDMTAHFDIPKKRAVFTDRVEFEGGTPRPSFQFRLGDDYTISSIADEKGAAVPFNQAGGVVSVAKPERGRFAYSIRYAGVVDRPMYAGSISSDEVLLAQDYWYPTVAREAAPYSLTAYTPKGWRVVGQGVLESQREEGDQTASTFKMDLPVVYYSFSASPYHVATDKIGKWTFNTYSRDASIEELHIRNVLQSDVIAFYDKEFWPYPFPSWSTVATPRYGGGALEAYSYATYGSLPGEDPHEPSHTWWGGIMPNSYLRSQWNESFADFSQGLFGRERPLGNREERRLAFISDPTPNEGFNASAVDNDPPELGPVAGTLGYGKGAVVLQMLENELGTDTMLKCMRDWIQSHRSGDLAEWEGFEKAVTHVTGQDYDWFFQQWLRRPGWADFDVTSLKWADGKLTGRLVFRGPTYRLKLEAMLQYPSGKRELESVESDSSFSFDCPAKPALVSVDPWRRLVRTYHADEAPISLSGFVRSAKRFTDRAREDWLPFFKGSSESEQLPGDLNGVLIVGSPATLPVMRVLCQKAGFEVKGEALTYDGTTIDLRKGTAMAIVGLPNGGHCCIALGKTHFEPDFGRASLCLVDEYGRFLRGKTEPKTTGFLTFRL